jgi:hypothetical protein
MEDSQATVSKTLENHSIVASPIAREDFIAEAFRVSKTSCVSIGK